MAKLCRSQASRFVREGFVLLPRFLDEGEVAETRTAVDSLLRAPPDCTCSRPHNTLLPLRWNHRIVQILLASARRLNALTKALDADDIKWISGYVSIKDAHTPALWWHQDWWCWDHAVSYRRAAAQVAVLCYLTRTDVHNGALRVLPGSHHRRSRMHAFRREPDSDAANDLQADHVAMTDDPDEVTLGLMAGDAVAIDYRLLHGTHRNASDARRDCVILNFTPCWRDLPADIKGHLMIHPAQPNGQERPPASSWEAELLPSFSGFRKSLRINRMPPKDFESRMKLSAKRVRFSGVRR